MSSGGKRIGAGRPKGEPTKAIRVPIKYIVRIQQLIKEWQDDEDFEKRMKNKI